MRPNFLVLGAAKAGTTALQHYLDAHPQIHLCPRKDSNFLAWEPGADRAKPDTDVPPPAFPVRDLAAWEALFDGAGEARVVGEICTYYLESPVAPARARELIPDGRLIIMLRNPVDRAYSGYQMMVRLGLESRPAAEALTPDSHYVRASRYGTMVGRWLDEFPRSRLCVVLFEDFKRDGPGIYAELCRFLGVDDSFVPDLGTRHNVGGVPKSRLLHGLYTNPALRRRLMPLVPPGIRRLGTRFRNRNMVPAQRLSPELRARLAACFPQENALLSEATGLDLAVWGD